jgi:hypothetical protein
MARRVFDPAALRANHDDLIYRMAVEKRGETDFNAFFWANVVADVALAHLVGTTSDPAWHVAEMLEIAREELRARARAPAPSEPADALYNLHRAHEALAIADWIATGERQPATMGLAHDLYRRYFARTKKPLLMSVHTAIETAIAAERFAAGIDAIDAHLSGKRLDPAKVRTPAELCLALSAGEASDALARRYLRGQLAHELGGGDYLDAAVCFYIATIAGLSDPMPEALASAPDYVSYLHPKKPPAKLLAELPVARISPAPSTTTRPPRIIGSEAIRRDEPRAQWERTEDGWALFLRGLPDATAKREIEARAGELVEWSQVRGLSSSSLPSGGLERLTQLRRATLDAPMLAEWARHPGELPLEVAFSLPSSHAFVDRRRESFPPKLKQSTWRDALAVGALTHLRALSLDGTESAKDRARRAAGPYTAVPAWFVKSKLAAQLEALELVVSTHDIADSLRLFDVLPRLEELILWIDHNIDTACFWCSRRDGVHLQARGLGVDDRLRGQSAWDALLQTALTPAAATRLGKARVTTIVEDHVDPATIRATVGRYIDVGEVTVGGALREL